MPESTSPVQPIDPVTIGYADNKEFAKVGEDGSIITYPVFAIHIRNRGESFKAYKEVEEVAIPPSPKFHMTNIMLSYDPSADIVRKGFNFRPMDINEILRSLRPHEALPIDGRPGSDVPENDITIADVPEDTIEFLYASIVNVATEKLNVFARSRGYDDIKSLVSYNNSPKEKYRKEGQRGDYWRGEYWEILETYYNELRAGIIPVPRTDAEILSRLPNPTWED